MGSPSRRAISSPSRAANVADYFDLRQPERNAIQRLLEAGRQRLRERHPEVAGFTSGSTQARRLVRPSSIAMFISFPAGREMS
jgi:hypothetical protein